MRNKALIIFSAVESEWMASMIHSEMRKYGIKLVLGYTVEGFKEKTMEWKFY